MVLRTEGGAGRAIAAHHSQSLESLWTHFPGIYVVMPSTSYDAKGLLKAAIRDITLVTYSRMVFRALEAADILAKDGIDVEVIDLRTLKPLDLATIVASVKKTGRLVRVASANVPVPRAENLEDLAIPNTSRIMAACRKVVS